MNKPLKTLKTIEDTTRHSIFNPKDKLSERMKDFDEKIEKLFKDKKENINKQNIKQINRKKSRKQDIDQFITNKLNDYILLTEEEYVNLHVGQHIRYTSNVYKGYDEKTKTTKRKCVYAVIKKILGNNSFEVNGYKPIHPNWNINLNNKYKMTLIYIKK